MTMFDLNYYTQMVVTRNNYENYGIDFCKGTLIQKGFYSLVIMETSRWGPYFFLCQTMEMICFININKMLWALK
jgi:hypothetical protein